jgi:hypothetical protein
MKNFRVINENVSKKSENMFKNNSTEKKSENGNFRKEIEEKTENEDGNNSFGVDLFQNQKIPPKILSLNNC